MKRVDSWRRAHDPRRGKHARRTLRRAVVSVLAAVASFTLALGPVHAGEWKFPLGLSYVDGFRDVVDRHEEGFDTGSTYYLPVGVSFHPFYQFDHGSMIGIDVGPTEIVYLEASGPFQDSVFADEPLLFWDLPVGVTYGFTFLPEGRVSPYVRAGIRYHWSGGDFVDGSYPGFFGAAGVDFGRASPIGVGIEIGFDRATVRLRDEKIRPGNWMASLRILF